jgi:triosephosphate isomerase (TIM)
MTQAAVMSRWLSPPFPFLPEALFALEGSGIKVGAQNIGLHTSGAFTGEVSASQVRSMGVDYVMLGHSERRSLFDETDADINAKVHLCLQEQALSVILCVGETEEEYDSELLQSVCDLQVRKGLRGVFAVDVLERVAIAYEPVWAIGTGKVATPEQAQEAHRVIRKTLQEMYGYQIASQVRIQYGGSVKPDNVDELMVMPDVDGALVGGASLTADSFTRIVDGARSSEEQQHASTTTMRPKERYQPKTSWVRVPFGPLVIKHCTGYPLLKRKFGRGISKTRPIDDSWVRVWVV